MDSIVVKKAPSIIPRKTHVYILGDSLVSNYYGTFADEDGDGIPTAGDAQTGWGQVMDKFISSDLNVTTLQKAVTMQQACRQAHSLVYWLMQKPVTI